MKSLLRHPLMKDHRTRLPNTCRSSAHRRMRFRSSARRGRWPRWPPVRRGGPSTELVEGGRGQVALPGDVGQLRGGRGGVPLGLRGRASMVLRASATACSAVTARSRSSPCSRSFSMSCPVTAASCYASARAMGSASSRRRSASRRPGRTERPQPRSTTRSRPVNRNSDSSRAQATNLPRRVAYRMWRNWAGRTGRKQWYHAPPAGHGHRNNRGEPDQHDRRNRESDRDRRCIHAVIRSRSPTHADSLRSASRAPAR
jgi:hypothetical protein